MRRSRLVLTSLLAIIVGVVAYRAVPPPVPVVSKQDFIAEVQMGHVTQVILSDDGAYAQGVSSSRGEMLVRLTKDDLADLTRELSVLGVRVLYQSKSLGLI